MSVFVLDQRHRALMPCSERRARLLLARGRAAVHRTVPFTIRLKDRRVEQSMLQPVVLKLDPGSRTTGVALARVEQREAGEVHHALALAHLEHRGHLVHAALLRRAAYRRRRRSANLHYRAPRFLNRRRRAGWLPPSLQSRIGNVLTWGRRFARRVPLARIEVERVKFDLALLSHPELSGVAYQRGELVGWEIRAYLLEKFQRRCGSCGQGHLPLEIDHVLPRSRGGGDRVSNLVLACHRCNQEKGDRTAREFGHPEVEAQARAPLRDAAVVNSTRSGLCETLRALGLPPATWSGGRTRWNRDRFGVTKRSRARCPLLWAISKGWCRARGACCGSPRTGEAAISGPMWMVPAFHAARLSRRKQIRGFQTGDLVCATVPAPLQTAGIHVGRVAVRVFGSFKIGSSDGINAKYCQVVQHADGYAYALVPKEERSASSPA